MENTLAKKIRVLFKLLRLHVGQGTELITYKVGKGRLKFTIDKKAFTKLPQLIKNNNPADELIRPVLFWGLAALGVLWRQLALHLCKLFFKTDFKSMCTCTCTCNAERPGITWHRTGHPTCLYFEGKKLAKNRTPKFGIWGPEWPKNGKKMIQMPIICMKSCYLTNCYPHFIDFLNAKTNLDKNGRKAQNLQKWT